MPAPSFFSSPGTPTTLRDVEEVDELARWVLHAARTRPLIVLTVPLRQRTSYFDPHAVIATVGDQADVVVVAETPDHRLTRRLQAGLPSGLEVYNGAARIYWPVSQVGDRPAQHPLVRADSPATSSAERRARLAGRWRQGPIPPPAAPPAPEGGEIGLLVAIVRAHLQLLPDLEDRRRHPLAPHVALGELVDQVDALELAREPVAAAAAAVLSGHAWRGSGPVPERLLRDGAPILRDGDQAVAWRMPLQGSDRYLAYWQPAVGPTELHRIASADDPRPSVPTRAEVLDDVAPSAPTEPPEAPKVPVPGPRFAIDDDRLLAAFAAARGPMRAAEIRDALGVPDDVSPQVLRRILTAAMDRGLLIREGERRAARYRRLTT